MSVLVSVLICARRLLIGIVAAYVITSLTLGGRRAAEPVFQSLSAGWCVSVLLWHRFRIRHLIRECLFCRQLHVLESLAGYLALLLVLAEVALRAASGISPADRSALDGHRLVPGHDYGAGLRGNSLGYPGPEFRKDKPAGTFRIAALGNSFAIGPTVPFADNYLTLLEARLPGVELYNFGVSGAGLRDYVAILRSDVWAYQPDLVLVSLLVSHDLTEFLPRPRYLDPRRHALYLSLPVSGKARRPAPPRSRDGAKRLMRPALSEDDFFGVQTRRLDLFRSPPLGSVEKKWQRAWADLETLASGCRNHGVPLALVLIPDECQVNDEALTAALRIADLARTELDLGLPQRRLREFCEARAMPCLDLRTAFTGAADAYTTRDTHWNVKGNHLGADAIAAWIRETCRPGR